MDKDHAREIAEADGLTRLSDKHLDQLAQAVASARELAGRLPKDLHWSEEIALALRLPTPKETKR